jgi:fatty-acyl-CoA synthase
VYLACVPYFHVACVPHIAALMRGMQVVVSGFDPRKVVQRIERYGVTHVAMVPTMVSMVLDVLDAEEHEISSIRRVLYAASPMPEPTLRRGIARFGSVFEQFYGLTETAGLVTILRPAEHDVDKPGRLGSCGREVNRVDVMLVDGAGVPVEHGQPGEIVVRGANVMRGYWGQPEATADAHFGEWFRTGDAAVRGSDGFLTIVGRLKDMIISGGSNVYPVEVEKVLEDHPSIREVAVVGVPHEVWGESVVAMVVGSEDVELDELRAWCRDRLADYKHPRRVCQLDALPRNALGKVDKQALRERAIASPPPGSGSTDA